MQMEFDRDFREFVESFIEHDVRFLIVGGYGLAAHGLPRNR
jgi:2-hydroxy-3-keto-5-methylthiopentenyl-1-phosphate phosphatase